jgi:hypothetical protein
MEPSGCPERDHHFEISVLATNEIALHDAARGASPRRYDHLTAIPREARDAIVTPPMHKGIALKNHSFKVAIGAPEIALD